MSLGSQTEKSPAETESDGAGDGCESAVVMDRGLVAWLQVFGSWILFMNTWGLTNSYGVFEAYYANTLLPTHTASAIAWIGSIQLFLTMIVGILTGWLLDEGRLKLILIMGTFLEVFGMMMTSISTHYWQILLSQAICTGLGSGLLGLTSVAVIPLYFSKRRMIATGIAATGSSLTGIIYPIMLQHLFNNLGFAWAVRVLAFVMLTCLGVCCAVMRLPSRTLERKKRFSLHVFQDKGYAAFVIAFALMIMSVYVPFFFIQEFALSLGVGESMAFYLLAIMNASSLFGRLLPNFLADVFGGLNIMIPCCFLSGALIFAFRAISGFAGLVTMSVLYGLISGGMVSLPPAIIANLTEKPQDYGVRMGVGYTVAAFGALIGNPIAGAAQRRGRPAQERYQDVWFFSGAVMMLCTGLLVGVQMYRRKHGQSLKR